MILRPLRMGSDAVMEFLSEASYARGASKSALLLGANRRLESVKWLFRDHRYIPCASFGRERTKKRPPSAVSKDSPKAAEGLPGEV
jgi:hypothetical protein